MFVSLAVDILYNVAASSTEETVFYSLLAVNASITMVMSVTCHFTQSFNDLNNSMGAEDILFPLNSINFNKVFISYHKAIHNSIECLVIDRAKTSEATV